MKLDYTSTITITMAILLMGSLTVAQRNPGSVDEPVVGASGNSTQSHLRGDQDFIQEPKIPATPETSFTQKTPSIHETVTTTQEITSQKPVPIQTTCPTASTTSIPEEDDSHYSLIAKTIIKLVKLSMPNTTETEILIVLSLWIWGFTMMNFFAILVISCVLHKQL